MDCETTLKQAITTDDPMQNLVQTFGNSSLEKWLEIGFGDTIGKCLTEEAENGGLFVLNYLGIVNTIIPPIPSFMDDEFGTISLEGCLLQSDLNQVAKLITQIIKPVIVNCRDMFTEPLRSKVLLKTIYYASENAINDDVISLQLISVADDRLKSCCDKSSHIAMALITILVKKMPDAWFQNFVTPRIFLKMRMIVMRSEEKMCPYVNSLRKLYYELNLEEKFEIKFPRYKALLETSHMSQEDCLVTDLRCISQIISDNDICMNKFIMSDLLHKFHTLLCEPTKIGDQTFVIKSFLTVFLSFETNTESHYDWKSDLFEKLVVLVRDTIEFLLLTSETRYSYREVHKDSPLTTIERFESEAILAAQLLESLYVLNSSWHQWFDILDEKKIIDDYSFQSFDISCRAYDETKQSLEIDNFPLLANFIKTCPAIVSSERRHKIFKKMMPKHSKTVHVVVTRTISLTNVFRLLNHFENRIHDYWKFSLEDELARGPGVAREVYSIYSQQIQNPESGLWEGEPFDIIRIAEGLSHEVKFTYLRDGLVPEVNNDIKNYKLLGKFMAKAILDKQFLDVPLSNEFFQRLRTTHVEKYSHLKRKYFDLLQTFPMLESLFKQLLPVKRKIELIKTEVGLTQRQKQEIIGNLTFDDGSSFDDLCLNFTIPGTDVELIDDGRNIILSPYNIDTYLEILCVCRRIRDPVYQFKAIREGFDEVLPPGSVDLLLPEELKCLFCCDEFRRWTLNDLQSNCKYNSSQSVGFLFETLSSFDTERQKMFLKFVTGMTSLPFGGLSKLDPPLTIKTANRDHADSSLPTAASCFNLLYLPEYSSLSITREKLLHAIHEGSNSFGFV